jgi:hypothetical protein
VRRRKRWQWRWSGRRLDLCFPHGPRDYPFWTQLRQWFKCWVDFGSYDWPCSQVIVLGFYIRWWWGAVRWSAKAQDLVPIDGAAVTA